MTWGEGGWCDEDIATLRQMWDAKISTQTIAYLIKRSKNAVVGKAHRLGLEARPSPIKRSSEPRSPRRKRVPRETIPVLSAPVAGLGETAAARRSAEIGTVRTPPAHAHEFLPVTPQPLIPARTAPLPLRTEPRPALTCETIVSPARRQGGAMVAPTLCGKPRDGARPFCAECAARFYEKRVPASLRIPSSLAVTGVERDAG
jgi:GcrA cell cycle regulator